MPAILPIIPLAIGAAIGTTTSLIIGAVVAVGLSLLLNQTQTGVSKTYTANSVSSTYTTDPTQLTFQADAPRRMVYGKARVSGVVAYANILGDGYEYLWLVVVVAAHKITEITQIYFDSDAGPDVADGYYEWWYHDGTQTVVDPVLHSTFSEWTDDCILKGCAYAVVKLKYDKTVWIGGRPNIQFDVKGRQVYDPRDGVTRWCNNAALCLADFMISEDGLGALTSEIDWELVKAAADISDQIPGSLAASLCDGRYTIDGVVELSTKNGDTISQMLAACAGTVVFSEGMYRIYVGAARSVVSRTITPDDLRGNPSLQPRTPSDQSFNSVKGTFLDSTNDWVFNDFPPVIGDSYVEQDGGVVQYKDIQLNFTVSPITAQRLSTIFLRRARLEKTIMMPCKWACFNYEVWDVVSVNLPQLGWISKLFQITSWKLTPPSTDDPGGVDLTLTEYSDDIYSDDITIKPITGGGVIIKPDVTIPNPLTSFTATSGATAVNGSTGNPRVRFDWPVSPDIYCVGYEVAYGKYPFSPVDSDYIFISGRNTIRYYSQDLAAGDTYIGYIRVVNSYENRSATLASNTIVISGIGSEYPEDLTGLTATIVDALYVDLTWIAPVGEAKNTAIKWAENVDDYANAILVAYVELPQTSLRVQRNVSSGYYFAAFMSEAGLFGVADSVYSEGRTPATVIQTAQLDKYSMDLVNGVWVNPSKAVPVSQNLASEIGWEVFDMMIPNPYGQVEAWKKSSVYQAPTETLRASGSVGMSRAPTIPGSLTPVNTTAKVIHYESTEYKQGTFVLSEDANIKLGFIIYVVDPQGIVINSFNGLLERL